MRKILSVFILLSLSVGAAFGAPPSRPKLVVGIVIDQFRYDYLERFADLFGEGGFRRLIEGGAVFSDAQYMHSVTVTSSGHAAFMTGSTPSRNGVIANEWFDRATGKVVTSVSDETVQPVGSMAGKASSPRRLIGSTLGDELKLSTGGVSRVIGVSMKDRSAILPAGHHPDGAFWFDEQTGRFITSTYYMKELPSWVTAFNARHPVDEFFGRVWKKLRPEADYVRSGIDDSPYERPGGGKRTFPYTINGNTPQPSPAFYSQFLDSPFSNEVLAAFAKAAIEGEDLGNHAATDLLTISFSCNDVIGHDYGPYSHEVEDVTLRTDLVFSDLFAYLDRKLGRDNYIVALTADHGVSPSPEQARDMDLGGGRYNDEDVVSVVSSKLVEQFGDAKWLLSFENDNIYLDRNEALRHGVDFSELARAAADATQSLPQFAAAYTAEDFKENRFGFDAIAQRISRSYFAGRTGDVFLLPLPYYVTAQNTTGHGTPYSYDTNVPVVFWGAWFVPGRYTDAASPADIAPTLASILHVTRPSVAVGRVLTEALVTVH
jgi:predicted AlkP superfamily pyrophosphatase or phosphodiesterase